MVPFVGLRISASLTNCSFLKILCWLYRLCMHYEDLRLYNDRPIVSNADIALHREVTLRMVTIESIRKWWWPVSRCYLDMLIQQGTG